MKLYEIAYKLKRYGDAYEQQVRVVHWRVFFSHSGCGSSQGQLDQAFIHLMKFCNLSMKHVMKHKDFNTRLFGSEKRMLMPQVTAP